MSKVGFTISDLWKVVFGHVFSFGAVQEVSLPRMGFVVIIVWGKVARL